MTTRGHEVVGSTAIVVVMALAQLVARWAVVPRLALPPASIPAAGTIALSYAGRTWDMDANDGSITTVLAHPVVMSLTFGTYSGLRWELVAKETGQGYQVQPPHGTTVTIPHRDLFARGVCSGRFRR